MPPRRTSSTAGVQGSQPVDARVLHQRLGDRVGQEAGHPLCGLGERGAVRLHADGVDDGVRAAPLAELPDGVRHLRSSPARVEAGHAVRVGAGETLGDEIDTDDGTGAAVLCDTGGHVADGPQTQDGYRAAVGNGRVLDRLPRGGQDVGEVDEAVVGRTGGDLDGQLVAERDAQQLGLSARHLSVQLGVAEERRPHAPVTYLRGLALGVEPLVAHETVAAADVEGDDHPVSRADLRHVRPDLLDDAHRLVAQDVAGVQIRPEEFVQMQVGPADTGRGDPYDDVVRLLDPRIGDGFHPDIPLALPSKCAHDVLLLPVQIVGGRVWALFLGVRVPAGKEG